MTASFKLGVVILGAGASRRMGRQKLLLPWGNSTVVGHLIASWRKANVPQVVIVHRPAHVELELELDRIGHPPKDRIVNRHAEEGMFSSLIAAARWDQWDSAPTHYLIALGDQPQLDANFLLPFLKFAQAHGEEICQPSFQGRRRHPVILPKTQFAELAVTLASTLREFLNSKQAALWESDNAWLNADLDTPEDYDRLSARWRSDPVSQ